MQTMYDRLGELLNETLEKGFIKSDSQKEKNSEDISCADKKNNLKNNSKAENIFKRKNKTSSNDFFFKSASYKNKENTKNKKEIFNYKKSEKTVTEEIKRALKLLSITEDFDENILKKAYKEKLNYYHPDKNSKSAIVQKVAAEKTRQVLQAYRLLLDFISS